LAALHSGQLAAVKVVTLPGVFSPISDSWLLADALRRETLWEGARVLDLCTGSGALAITAAQRGAAATAVDVSRRAVLTARINARLNGVRVRALRGSLFEPVRSEQFDCIVSNPPYVPSTSDELPRTGASRAWDAGRDGRVLLDRIIGEAPAHLRPNGVLLLTHSTLIGEQETLERLRAGGLHAEVVERRRGPLGPLMQERKREGVIPEHVHDEEVLIVRGQLKAAKSGKSVAGDLPSPSTLA
jgi:release factor glutamine methyltransferase